MADQDTEATTVVRRERERTSENRWTNRSRERYDTVQHCTALDSDLTAHCITRWGHHFTPTNVSWKAHRAFCPQTRRRAHCLIYSIVCVHLIFSTSKFWRSVERGCVCQNGEQTHKFRWWREICICSVSWRKKTRWNKLHHQIGICSFMMFYRTSSYRNWHIKKTGTIICFCVSYSNRWCYLKVVCYKNIFHFVWTGKACI